MTAAVFTARADLSLLNPERVMTRLSRHFAHKITVQLAPPAAQLMFAEGRCELLANDGQLNIQITASDGADRAAIVETLERHLPAFAAAGEAVSVQWQLSP